MTPPKRVIITNCPHGGRHQDMKGYVVDSYPDGTASVDVGHNHCCITSDYIEIEHVRREELVFQDDGLTSAPEAPEPKKRRGRPPRSDTVASIKPPKPAVESPPQPEPVQAKSSAPTRQDILVVTAVDGSKVSLVFQRGTARIELQAATADDLERISSILESLTREANEHA